MATQNWLIPNKFNRFQGKCHSSATALRHHRTRNCVPNRFQIHQGEFQSFFAPFLFSVALYDLDSREVRPNKPIQVFDSYMVFLMARQKGKGALLEEGPFRKYRQDLLCRLESGYIALCKALATLHPGDGNVAVRQGI